jgi:Type II secretion system (T2SS), protein F
MTYMLAALLGGGAVFVAVGGFDRLAASTRLRRLSDGGRPRRLVLVPSVMPQLEPGSAVRLRSGRAGDGACGQPSATDSRRPVYGWPRIRYRRPERWPVLRRVRALERLPARRRIERQNRSAVLGLCAAIGAELRAGRQPREALDRAGLAWPRGAPRALSAARAGHEVVDALKLDAKEPGRGGLRALAVCWQVAEHHGAGLATAVGQITASLRTDEEHRGRLAAELAGPRATARLLALLPLVGIAMGQALDADPLRLLVSTSWGRLALAAGISLEVCGAWWVSRIASEVERSL